MGRSLSDNLVHDFSDLLKNAVIRTKALPRSKYTSKKKKKQKPNKPWYDDECKVKLRHINSLGHHLQRSPWDKGLRSKVYAEKKTIQQIVAKNI